jgi:hypothetical protein
MMELSIDYGVLALAAFFASLLTFFSGFGLGTVLLPVFTLFFPLTVSIAMTAVVHFLNNVFKFALVVRHAQRSVVFRFGVPAMMASFAGAWVLTTITGLEPIANYSLGSWSLLVTPVKLAVATILIIFALLESWPRFKRLEIDPKYVPVGGFLSGFFGGLSGHQGALRSAFLLRLGLTKEQFVDTGITLACLIDISRLFVYTTSFTSEALSINYLPIALATISAVSGAYAGFKLLPKVTLTSVHRIVLCAIVVFAIALGLGLI